MTYIKDYENSQLLKEAGMEDMEELFADIPERARIQGLELPDGMEEWELIRKMKALAGKNKKVLSFMGGGIYPHYIPSAVKSIISRGEFLTSYTPFQPEVSQGMLQSIFEFQSQICELTGMEVANASLYDGGTAAGEAALMAVRIARKKNVFLIPENISVEKKEIIRNYVKGARIEIKEIPFDRKTGQIRSEELEKMVTKETAGVYIENPNYFGVLEESLPEIKEILPKKCMLVVGINPISLSIIKPPGTQGADIVVGEGQPLGLPQNLGGPMLGIMAAKKKYVRKMPGRIIGLTKDSKGNRAFAMTLMTREQHIRREKATSNICTNQSLCALTASAYLSIAGKTGLRKIALLNLRNAHELAQKLNEIPGVKAPYYSGHYFNEFSIKLEGTSAVKLKKTLLKKGIEPGIPIGETYGEQDNLLLTCSTEMHKQEDHEKLVSAISAALKK